MNILPLLTFYFINSRARFLDHDMSYEIAQSLLYVIEGFFVPRSSSFVFILSCEREQTMNFYKDLVEVIFDSWGNIKTQIVINSEPPFRVRSGERIYNLLLVDSSESFLKIDPASKVGKYDSNEYYYILLQNRDQFIGDDIQRIFSYCWRNYITNVNIQVQKSSGEIIVYTYFPFTKLHCGKVIPEEINRYRNGSWESKVLFPRKLHDMHNCPLRIGTWHVPPYITLDVNKKGRAAIGGCEGKLLKELSRLMNFDIEIIVPPNNEQRGVIMSNYSTGAIGMLLKRDIDLSLGGFWYDATRTRILTASVSYLHSTNAAVLLTSSANYSKVQTLWFPFELGASVALLATFLITFGLLRLFMRLLQKISKIYPAVKDRNITLNFIACTLGLPSSLDARWNSGRSFIMAWMLFGLVIRIQFGAVIYHLIRNNLFRKPPSTISDVMKLNYSLTMNSIAFNALRQTSVLTDTGLHIVMMDEKYPDSPLRYLEEHPEERFLTIAPLDFLLYYIAENRKGDVLTILKETFLQQRSCIYFPKHSFLAERASFLVEQINAVGLIDLWLKQSVDLTYLLAKKTAPVFTIGQRELKGIYYLCGIMMGISFLVFCLEIISLRIEFLRKVFQKL